MKKDDYQKFPKGTVIYKGRKYIFKIGDIISGKEIVGVKKGFQIPLKFVDYAMVLKCNKCGSIIIVAINTFIANIHKPTMHCRYCYKYINHSFEKGIYYQTGKYTIAKGDRYGDYEVVGYVKCKKYNAGTKYIILKCVNCKNTYIGTPANILKGSYRRCKRCNKILLNDLSKNNHWRKLWPVNVYYIYKQFKRLSEAADDNALHGFYTEQANRYGVSNTCITHACNKKINDWNWLTDQIDDGLTLEEIEEQFDHPPIHPHLYTTHLDEEHAQIHSMKKIIKERFRLPKQHLEYIDSIHPEQLIPPYDDIPYKELLSLEKAKVDLLRAVINKYETK